MSPFFPHCSPTRYCRSTRTHARLSVSSSFISAPLLRLFTCCVRPSLSHVLRATLCLFVVFCSFVPFVPYFFLFLYFLFFSFSHPFYSPCSSCSFLILNVRKAMSVRTRLCCSFVNGYVSSVFVCVFVAIRAFGVNFRISVILMCVDCSLVYGEQEIC